MEQELQNKVNTVRGYVDLNYRGWKSTSSLAYSEFLTFQLTNFSMFPSFLPYPLGPITQVFPSGGAIPLFTKSTRVKIIINWSNLTGKSRVLFYTANFLEISYSGLVKENSPMERQALIVTVPEEARYLSIKTESGELHLSEFMLYDINSIESESPLLVREAEAVKNCFKLWLFSSRGDYGRNIFKGGPVDTLLGSSISEVGASRIKDYLIGMIQENFVYLSQSDIQITPVPEKQTYLIKIILKDYYNNFISPIELEVS